MRGATEQRAWRWLAAALAALSACKGDPGPRRAPPKATPELAPGEPTAPPSAADAGPEWAVWRARIEATPGEQVLTWVNGPRRFGDEVWVGSSAIGVASLEPATGKVISHERAAGPFLVRPEDPDSIRAARVADADVVVTRSAVERVGAWRHAYDDRADLGVAGPIVLDGVAVLVVDETLLGLSWNNGTEVWRIDGRFSSVEGGLQAGAGGIVRAVALDGGVRPVVIDPRQGKVTRRGRAVDGLHALAAAWMPAGQLAAVVRGDATLLHDALAVFDASGSLLYRWPLPTPDAPRADPVGLLADGDGFVLFYDGRYCARFPAAPPAAPPASAPAPAASPASGP